MHLSQLLLTCNFKMIKPKDSFLIFFYLFFLPLSIVISSFPTTVVDWKIFFRKLHENHHVQLTVWKLKMITIYIIYIWACAKRCSVRTIHFLVLNASSGLSFLWTNLTLSERVCIKEIIKINLTPKVSSELVKYENLHQVRAENRQKKGGHFGCTASVVV